MKLHYQRIRIYITILSLLIAIIVFVVSYFVCEILEIIEESAQTDFTLIAKTIQLIVSTPINMFFCYLVVKFYKMGIYLH